MTAPHAPHAVQGPDFAPKSVRLSRTLIDAKITQRRALRGYGFGAVYSVYDKSRVAFAHNATTDARCRRCGVRCGLFASLFKGLSPLTTPQRSKPKSLHVCVRARAHMHAYTVVPLCRCASLYLPEKKEEKKGKPTTPDFLSVVGAVVALVKCLKSLNLRGF